MSPLRCLSSLSRNAFSLTFKMTPARFMTTKPCHEVDSLLSQVEQNSLKIIALQKQIRDLEIKFEAEKEKKDQIRRRMHLNSVHNFQRLGHEVKKLEVEIKRLHYRMDQFSWKKVKKLNQHVPKMINPEVGC